MESPLTTYAELFKPLGPPDMRPLAEYMMDEKKQREREIEKGAAQFMTHLDSLRSNPARYRAAYKMLELDPELNALVRQSSFGRVYAAGAFAPEVVLPTMGDIAEKHMQEALGQEMYEGSPAGEAIRGRQEERRSQSEISSARRKAIAEEDFQRGPEGQRIQEGERQREKKNMEFFAPVKTDIELEQERLRLFSEKGMEVQKEKERRALDFAKRRNEQANASRQVKNMSVLNLGGLDNPVLNRPALGPEEQSANPSFYNGSDEEASKWSKYCAQAAAIEAELGRLSAMPVTESRKLMNELYGDNDNPVGKIGIKAIAAAVENWNFGGPAWRQRFVSTQFYYYNKLVDNPGELSAEEEKECWDVLRSGKTSGGVACPLYYLALYTLGAEYPGKVKVELPGGSSGEEEPMKSSEMPFEFPGEK